MSRWEERHMGYSTPARPLYKQRGAEEAEYGQPADQILSKLKYPVRTIP